ncbi:MAG: hypothetical protein KAQ98_09950 [Bacteriovoracaceae bacterium]|nr:hypothetical protein [Bacteriovoracaceae bacterium]
MTGIGVGKEVLSYCTKCKLTLSHIIVSMKNDSTIGKVKCNTCEAVHAYKDPSKVKAKSKKAKSRKSSPGDSVADIWMQAINKSTAKSQDYSMKRKFLKGDIINHSKFGPGVVDKLIDNDKVQVIFRHNIRTLMHNKA